MKPWLTFGAMIVFGIAVGAGRVFALRHSRTWQVPSLAAATALVVFFLLVDSAAYGWSWFMASCGVALFAAVMFVDWLTTGRKWAS